MLRKCSLAVMFALTAITSYAQDLATPNEIKVTAKTGSVALFKNGYTVVQREIDIPGPGVYRWEEVPAVIHGTFFVESDYEIEVRTTQRTVSVPVNAENPPSLATGLFGKEVAVHLSSPTGDSQTVTGRLVDTTPKKETNSLLPELESAARLRYDYPTPFAQTPGLGTPIVLQSKEENHYSFLTGQQITHINVLEPVTERMEYRPVMLFHATGKDKNGAGKIRLFYLTKGTTWAPSYRVDLLDDKRLRIEQSAAIRNEGLPYIDTDVSLVSGFPQIECSQILSPLTPSQTLEQFFRQVTAQPSLPRNPGIASIMGNSMLQQVAVHPSATANVDFDTTDVASGEGPDIHYNAIGKRTLETGDTLSLTIGKGETEYRRILECDLTLPILAYYEQYYYNWRNPSVADRFITSEVFDVLKFPNPLSFPMTTAPALVMEKSRFLGQSQSGWVNPGQVASVKITKVMNISAVYSEKNEDIKPQETREYRGRAYCKRAVVGTIEIVNRRNEEITLHLNGIMLGKVGKIEPALAKQTVSAKDFYPNELTNLFWELKLKPGESQTITIPGTRWFIM